MSVVVPLDGVTVLMPGKLYSLDLDVVSADEGTSHYIGTIRAWRATDVEAPITVAEPTVANSVTLKELP